MTGLTLGLELGTPVRCDRVALISSKVRIAISAETSPAQRLLETQLQAIIAGAAVALYRVKARKKISWSAPFSSGMTVPIFASGSGVSPMPPPLIRHLR